MNNNEKIPYLTLEDDFPDPINFFVPYLTLHSNSFDIFVTFVSQVESNDHQIISKIQETFSSHRTNEDGPIMLKNTHIYLYTFET